jgi:phage shock protein E
MKMQQDVVLSSFDLARERNVMRSPVFLASILLATLAGNAGWSAEHTKDSLDAVSKALTDKKAILLDVREQSEWDDGHLKQAVLLPLSVLDAGADAKTVGKVLSKDKVIYIHCHSGRRCLKAADILDKQGYDVRPLKAGYPDLLKAGFPRADK